MTRTGCCPSGVPIAAIASDRRPARHRLRDARPDQRPAAGQRRGRRGRPAGRPTRCRPAPPTPSNVVEVPSIEVPGIEVPGTLVYAKDGNIWIQSGEQATQLTSPGKGVNDSMPSFSGGRQVRLLRPHPAGRRQVEHRRRRQGLPARRADADAGQRRRAGDTTRLLDGLVEPGRHLQVERVHPRAGRLARRPLRRDGDRPARPDEERRHAQAVRPQDRQDQATSARTRSRRSATRIRRGSPTAAGSCTCSTTATAPRARRGSTPGTPTPARPRGRSPGPATSIPSWSPDGKYIAATKTSAYGTDVVILNAATGAELARLTDDGNSWAPAWSPRGDQIAYLHVAGQVIDLRMAQLEGTGPTGRSRTRST